MKEDRVWLALLAPSLAAGVSCSSAGGPTPGAKSFPEATHLFDVDRGFARASAGRGAEAWAEIWADEGVLYGDGRAPAIGPEQVRQAVAPIVEWLRWEPTTAGMLRPDSLGYTFGRWWLAPGASGAAVDTLRYLTIWRRSTGDGWRVTLDLSLPAQPVAPGSIDTLALEAHMRFLADDLLEGRAPASRGERIAAVYLSSHLRALGLRPLSSGDYRLPVPLTAVVVDEHRAAVRITGGEEIVELEPPAFYHPGGSHASFRDFAGELVLAGAASGAIAALEGIEDLSGKVVVLTPPWSGIHEVETELLRRGAAGAVSLMPNGAFYNRLRIVRGPTRYFLPNGVEDPANQSDLPRIVGGPELIRALGLEKDARPGETVERARPLDRGIDVGTGRCRFDTGRRRGQSRHRGPWLGSGWATGRAPVGPLAVRAGRCARPPALPGRGPRRVVGAGGCGAERKVAASPYARRRVEPGLPVLWPPALRRARPRNRARVGRWVIEMGITPVMAPSAARLLVTAVAICVATAGTSSAAVAQEPDERADEERRREIRSIVETMDTGSYLRIEWQRGRRDEGELLPTEPAALLNLRTLREDRTIEIPYAAIDSMSAGRVTSRRCGYYGMRYNTDRDTLVRRSRDGGSVQRCGQPPRSASVSGRGLASGSP